MRDLLDQEFLAALANKITNFGDRTRFVGCVNDWKAAVSQLNGESSVANRKNLEEAEERYMSIVGEIVDRYDPDPDRQQDEDGGIKKFRTKKNALEYLLEAGWKIGQSQFYKHCKDGLLRPQADGSYAQKAVDKYAKTWLKQLATGQKVNDRMDRMQEEKLEADLRASKFKMEEAEFNLGVRKSKFIPRDDFELAIVGRAVAFMAHLNHTVQSEAADWIELVGGDQTRAPELVQAISRAIEQRMGDFAADAEFDVILEAN